MQNIASSLSDLVVDIENLIPDDQNARLHNERNLEAIKASLQKFGQQKPIVITNERKVIAGNGTLEAAKALGWTKIAVTVFTGTEAEARAYAIADNRTAELAEWDDEQLKATLSWLRENENFFDDGGASILDALAFDDFLPSKPPDGAKELNETDFQDFDKKCPRCGFEFDIK